VQYGSQYIDNTVRGICQHNILALVTKYMPSHSSSYLGCWRQVARSAVKLQAFEHCIFGQGGELFNNQLLNALTRIYYIQASDLVFWAFILDLLSSYIRNCETEGAQAGV
jgi:hypothetical protein